MHSKEQAFGKLETETKIWESHCWLHVLVWSLMTSLTGAERGGTAPCPLDPGPRHTWWHRLRMQNLSGEVTNVAWKTNSFRECALKIALTRSTFQPKMHKYRLAAGLRPNPLGELTALPQIPYGFKQWCIAKNRGGYTQRGVAKGLKDMLIYDHWGEYTLSKKTRRLVYVCFRNTWDFKKFILI